MTTDAEDYAATIAASIAEAEAADDPYAAATDYLAERALDVHYLVRGYAGGHQDVAEVRAIVTVGGPYAEVRGGDGTDRVRIVVRWWGDDAATEVVAPALAAELEHYADVMTVEVIR